MTSLELDDDTAVLLYELAEHENMSLAQLLKNLAQAYQNTHTPNKPPQLLSDFVGILKNSPSFNGDPLEIQQAMRDEWN
ncbi:MAG: hypothetical protein QX189_10005 [Methylococcales bacterium]